uniref:helix-turn-helix domain-containing protein n=1 Tax=Levilactobacillus sp. HBUAS70063 TaxID=3109359 RepID=UPI0031334EDD
MSYHRLTINERESILELSAEEISISDIAWRLRRSPSSTSRELKRLKGHYSPSKAQKKYQDNHHNCHKPRLLDQSPKLRKKSLISSLSTTGHPSRSPIA